MINEIQDDQIILDEIVLPSRVFKALSKCKSVGFAKVEYEKSRFHFFKFVYSILDYMKIDDVKIEEFELSYYKNLEFESCVT